MSAHGIKTDKNSGLAKCSAHQKRIKEWNALIKVGKFVFIGEPLNLVNSDIMSNEDYYSRKQVLCTGDCSGLLLYVTNDVGERRTAVTPWQVNLEEHDRLSDVTGVQRIPMKNTQYKSQEEPNGTSNRGKLQLKTKWIFGSNELQRFWMSGKHLLRRLTFVCLINMCIRHSVICKILLETRCVGS